MSRRVWVVLEKLVELRRYKYFFISFGCGDFEGVCVCKSDRRIFAKLLIFLLREVRLIGTPNFIIYCVFVQS